ncbi:MAG TPA: LPXTG cell wall anchor domain-containing protein [Clostridiales bacterium]|nr:LPXTG cell wall anchor domain-containing protein [Clostridiales bacterium]
MKRKHKLLQVSSAVLLVWGFLVSSLSVFAAGEQGKITLSFDFPDTAFYLYRVADYNGDDTYSYVGALSDVPVDITSDAAAATLENYVYAYGIEPDQTAVTGADGTLQFQGLNAGAYLILGDPADDGNGRIYQPTPTLLSLPHWEEEKAVWSRQVEAKKEIQEARMARALSVFCAFNFVPDEDFPDELDMEIYHKDEHFETVTVKKEENWEFHLPDIPVEEFVTPQWSVIPEKVPGYTVEVDKHLDENKNLVFKVLYDKEVPTDQKKTTPTKTLPRTGQNWTLVSGLAGAGLLFLLFGVVRYRKNNEEA